MEKFRYQFERLSLLIRTGIFFCEENRLEEYRPNGAFSPIRDNESFREKLLSMTRERKAVLLYQDSWQIIYIGIWNQGRTILAGPVSLKNLTQVELRRYYREYGILSGLGRAIPTYPLSVILAIAQMMAKEFTGIEYSEDRILLDNNMKMESEEQIEKEQLIFEIREDEPDRIAVGGGISAQPLFIQIIKEELKKLNSVYPYDMPIPEVVACKFFNDSNLIGALYVHLKSKEEQINLQKVEEFMGLMKNRREGQYLREMLMGN